MNIFRDIVAQTLRLHGALVDEIEHEGLEILSPKILQKELELPEICKLGFGDNLPDGSIRISIESDMVDKMERLLGNRGRLKIASIPPGILPVNQFDAEKILRKNLIFDNATFRFSESFPCVTIITSFTFSISAISNEKREEIISFSINEGSGNRADNFALLLADYERCNPSIIKLNEALQAKEWDPQTLSHSANAILPHEIKSRFEPFIAGMERRLKRDIDRV